jgi:hypothetical protein
MTHFKKFFNYKFISAEELDGKEVILTIKGIHKDEAYSQKKQAKESVPALEFKETEKMIILNVTNARKISEILGSPQVENWTGKRICLYPVAIQAFGQNVEAIRIKKVPASAPATTPPPQLKQIEYDNEPELATSDVAELEGGQP